MGVELKRLSLIDWDFPSRTSQVLMHDICWYPARFVPAIPSHLIEALSQPGESICDPFCGSGTTIVEALLLGRMAVGLDINPFAIHIARTKCYVVEKPEILKSASLNQTIKLVESLAKGEVPSQASPRVGFTGYRRRVLKGRVEDRQERLFSYQVNAREVQEGEYAAGLLNNQYVDHEEIERWFHPQTLRQLYILHSLLNKITPDDVRQILETVFIATLMPASGHRSKKPYGYFADNVVPKEKLYRNAFELFYKRASRLISRCAQLGNDLGFDNAPKYTLRVGDSRSEDLWHDVSVDCIITSPPYPGAVDYCTAFRLASYWFPHYGQIEEMRRAEIGARWARRRKSSRHEYFEDMRRVFARALAHLVPHGIVALVLPISRTQSPTISRIVRSLLDADGLREIARTERRILRRYFVRQGGGIKREAVMVFRKE